MSILKFRPYIRYDLILRVRCFKVYMAELSVPTIFIMGAGGGSRARFPEHFVLKLWCPGIEARSELCSSGSHNTRNSLVCDQVWLSGTDYYYY